MTFAYSYSEHADWDNRGSDPTWNSGLKTIPNHTSRSRSRARSVPREPVPRSSSAGDISRSRISRQKQFVHSGDWSSGLKTLDSRAKLADRTVSQQRSKSVTREIAEHADHGRVADWEYTGTLHKTLDHEGAFKMAHESWNTENSKILDDRVHPSKHVIEKVSAYNDAPHRFETETVPTEHWDAGRKVVPCNRTKKYLSNNHLDYDYRNDELSRSARGGKYHPGDGSWNTENFKVVEERGFKPGPRMDNWEGGLKLMPNESRPLRQSLSYHGDHPHSWFDENLKTLDPRETKYRGITKFTNVNTGWDSGLYKTFDPQPTPRAFSANDEWACRRKVMDPEPKKKIETYGTGWDSGIKTLDPKKSKVKTWKDGPRPGDWDRDNRKTLDWSVEQSFSKSSEGSRHIAMPRHMDMMQFHARLCGHDGRPEYN